MNMKKLVSIGAMSLAIACCTSITTFAAESKGNRKEAVTEVINNFYKGKEVINNLKITINTPIKDYANSKLIDKIKGLDIADFDTNKGIKENLEKIKENEESLTNSTNLTKIKTLINELLNEFIVASEDGNLNSTIKDYILVDQYGVLSTGKNSDNKTTASIIDKSGKIVLQVNSDEVNEVKAKLTGVNSWSQLMNLLVNYNLDGILK